jgi:hypothetical protein
LPIRHAMTLSTTEPNNHVGLIKVRQEDTNSQIFDVTIEANGKPVDFTGLTPFFVVITKDGQPIEQRERMDLYPSEGCLTYTLNDRDWQWIGENTAYFSFRRLHADGTWSEMYSTRDFTYQVTQGVTKSRIKDSGYIWTYEELLRMFKNAMATNQADWEKWVEDNKAIISSVDPSGDLLNKIIEAQGDYDSLADRLNATVEVDVDKTVGGVLESKVMPRNLDNVRKNLKSTDFNFGFITDLHAEFIGWPTYYGYGNVAWGHIRNVQSLSDKLDCIVYGGDNVNCSYGSKERNIKLNEKFAAMIARQPIPNLPVIGNHDGGMVPGAENGRSPQDSLTTADFIKIFGFKDQPYYFKDFASKKVRVICLYLNDYNETLDSTGKFKYHTDDGVSEFAIRQKQFEFLVDALTNCPADYHVLLIGHAPLTITGQASIRNGDLFKQLIEAYKSSSRVVLTGTNEGHEVSCIADFTGRAQGVVIGYFCGHMHKQEISTVGTITQAQATLSAIYNNWDPGNDDEDAFWAVAVDTTARKVTCHGIGRGKDTTFYY